MSNKNQPQSIRRVIGGQDMRDLSAIIEFWTGVAEPEPSATGVRLIAARSILAAKAAMRDTLPAGLVHDPAVEILMSLYIGGADAGRMRHDAACAAAGVTASVATRWLMELEARGLIVVTTGVDGKWVALSDKGFAQTARAIDEVVARQAALLG